MTRKRHVALAAALLLASSMAYAQRTGEHWITTWGTATVVRPPQPPTLAPRTPAPPPLHFNSQTLRQIVRTSIGGTKARVIFSNTFGTAPLMIGAASLALRDKDAAVVAPSVRRLTFAGQQGMRIPAGAIAYSDAVDLNVPPRADLAIDIYLPNDTNTPSPLTTHGSALQTNYVTEPGNHAGAATLPVLRTTPSWFLLARVEVSGPAATGAVVTLGDSITDGTRSTPDANRRWPDRLAERFAVAKLPMAVIDVGIAGNRLLTDGAGVSALARFDRDVVAQTGVTHLIVLEGINDIGMGGTGPAAPTADDLIAAHTQIIERARARGLRVFGATLTPFDGTTIVTPQGPYFTPQGEAKRRALNEWIRTSKAYDAVIDFDAIVRDPAAPAKLLPLYDSGDHLHPSDAGYQAMANAVDLALFRGQTAK